MRKAQRQSKAEGEDLGGTQLRSRMEQRERDQRAKDIQSRIMEAGKQPDFRDRPEIQRMRSRAKTWRAEQ